MTDAPSTIGQRYLIHDLLSEGAMGCVYRAHDRLTGQTVALKRVTVASQALQFASRPSDADPNALLLALAQEFKLLAALRHPHIISVLDYGFDSDRQPFFTIELLTQPLTLLQAGQGQPLATLVDLLVQALQALAYLHRRGILHHDLKPANVLVSAGWLRLLDFGLSVVRDQPRADDSFGTLLYMPPEVLEGDPFTPAGDLYALGVMAYELLVGRHSFVVDDVSVLLDQVLDAAPDLTPLAATPALAAVLSTLPAKRPAQRYPDAEAAIAALCAAASMPTSAESPAIRESYLQAATFVGREAELGQLTLALDALLAGQGSAWLLGGESGVGKSRLLDELRTRALVVGALVLRGRGIEGGGLPYQLWRDPLRRLVLGGDLSDLEVGVLKELLPDIAALLGRAVPDVSRLDGVAERTRLTLTLVDLVRRQDQPLVLLLEDLQWASESLEVLGELLRLAHDRPLLVVGSYRDDERPDLPGALPGMQVLRLGRLAPAEIAALSASMLGEVGQQPQVVALLERETEGNTFFMVEVVRALAEELGSLGEIGRVTLPTSVVAGGVQQIVRRRLERVPQAAQPLLKLAAVAGRYLDLAVLSILRRNPADLDDWLTACADAAVLEVADERWRFAHDKLRAALLAGLSPDERPALHHQVAAAIEAIYTDERARVAYAEALLEHWRQAGVPDKELDYILLAAEQAALLSAEYGKAQALIEQGEALLDRTALSDTSRRRMRLLKLRGDIALKSGDYPTGARYYQSGLALAQRLDAYAMVVQSLNGLAEINCRAGDYEQAATDARTALEVARRTADQSGAAESLSNLGLLATDQGDYVVAQDYYEQSLALARETDNPQGISKNLHNLGLLAHNQGDYAVAQDYYEQSLSIDRAIGDQRGAAITLHNLGSVAFELGDLTTAQDCCQQSLAICQAIGDQDTLAYNLHSLGQLVAARGDDTAAADFFQQSVALSHTIGVLDLLVQSLSLQATVQVRSQQVALARQTLGEALNVARLLDADPPKLITVIAAAQIALCESRAEQAAELAGLVLSHPRTSQEFRMYIDQIRPALAAALGEVALAAALDRGRERNLDVVVADLVAQLDTPS